VSILTRAADFARATTFDRLPGPVVETAKRALADCLGVTLAGSREPVSRLIQAHVRKHSARAESRVIGTGLRVTPDLAALANGTAGHALDYDDVSWTSIGHPSVTVAPAVLALAEAAGASGREVLTAYVLGIEIENKIAGLAMPQASERGWHTTSVFGPFGAAAACAWLKRLAGPEFVSALALAASTAGGLRSNFGTAAKPFHAGLAAFHGVLSGLLAGLGLGAAKDALEAADGFIQLFSGRPAAGEGPPFGEPWDLLEPGLVLKKYPCCSGAHPALDCLLEMLSASPFAAGEVEVVRVGLSLLGPRELVCHDPASPAQARFSLEYALAAAVVFGRVGLAEFSAEAVGDPRVRELMPRIRAGLDPELAGLGFIGTAPAKLEVVLRDGRVLRGRSDLARGNPEKPLSDRELEAKFLECAGAVLAPERCRRLWWDLMGLEEVGDLARLMDLLGPD